MSKFKDIPLHLMGDNIVAAYAKEGFRVGISITVADMTQETGEVNGTSNIDDDSELGLLRWVINERKHGRADVEVMN